MPAIQLFGQISQIQRRPFLLHLFPPHFYAIFAAGTRPDDAEVVMPREQAVLDLIGNIYDAALDTSRWPSVLQDLVQFTRSRTGNLVEVDLATGATRPLAAVNISSKGFADYAAYYWRHDIWTPKPGAIQIGAASSSQQHVADQVLLNSEFYHDWMKPLGLFYAIGGIPLVEGNCMFILGVHRPKVNGTPHDPADLRSLQRFFPHVTRALQIHQRLEATPVERDALADIADRLPRGLVTFNAQGRLLWMNRAAEALCAQQDGLTVQRGLVIAAVPAEAEQLHRLVRTVVLTAAGQGLASGDTMLVSRPSGRRPYIVLVCPLRVNRHRLDDRQPAAVAFVSDPERATEVPLDRLMRLYGLTRTEARLVQQLAAGHDLKNIAATSQRTMNTVRTQLKQIFQKTGTSRQAQLVRLVLQVEGASEIPPLNSQRFT